MHGLILELSNYQIQEFYLNIRVSALLFDLFCDFLRKIFHNFSY